MSTPQRVRVQHRDTTRRRRLAMAEEINRQTLLGEALLRSLVRAQLRLAIGVLGFLAVTIGALPLLFRLEPRLAHAHIAHVPLPWVVLGVLVYPMLLAVGWYYVVHAERNEAAFSELMDQS